MKHEKTMKMLKKKWNFMQQWWNFELDKDEISRCDQGKILEHDLIKG